MTMLSKLLRILVVVIVLLCIIATQVSCAYSYETTTKDKVTNFLSNVLELDLTKYSLIRPNSSKYYYISSTVQRISS